MKMTGSHVSRISCYASCPPILTSVENSHMYICILRWIIWAMPLSGHEITRSCFQIPHLAVISDLIRKNTPQNICLSSIFFVSCLFLPVSQQASSYCRSSKDFTKSWYETMGRITSLKRMFGRGGYLFCAIRPSGTMNIRFFNKETLKTHGQLLSCNYLVLVINEF